MKIFAFDKSQNDIFEWDGHKIGSSALGNNEEIENVKYHKH